MSFRLRSALSVLVLALLAMVGPAMAAENEAKGEDEVLAEKQAEEQKLVVVPLEYRLARTTREEAVAYWQASGASLIGRGYLALGTGSGGDNLAKALDRDVELVDVSGVDFEGMNTARFIFNKGVLYGIQADMASLLNQRSPVMMKYSAEEIDTVEKRLRSKYGKPRQINSILTGIGKKPDILIWKLGGSTLSFVSNSMNATVRLIHEKTEADVQKRRKEVCKEFNTRDRIICW